MKRDGPPWHCPAARGADGRGSTAYGAQGKPRETVGRKARRCCARDSGAMHDRLHQANQWKH